MEQFISEKRFDSVLREMEEAGARQFLLFSAEGELVSGNLEENVFSDDVRIFAGSSAESQTREGWIYLRVGIHGKTEYVLLCSEEDEIDQSYAIGRMALCYIRNLLLSVQRPEDRIEIVRKVFLGEIPGERAAAVCRQIGLKPRGYILFVIQCKNNADPILLEMVRNLFSDGASDLVVETDDNRIVLLKDPSAMGGLEPAMYADTIVDTLQAEAMTSVWVGFGDPTDSFAQMGAAYRDACTALDVGMVFYAEEKAFHYRQLGIGRLIYKLPADLCEMFLREVLGENMELDLDEEIMRTIQKLLENDLNISETARQLYVHRNTLVYRLERIEKKLGLDIRSFEDAMLFKIAVMVRVHLNELSVEKRSNS